MGEDIDSYRDSRFTAEISERMRVPDRIMVAGGENTKSPTFVGVNGPTVPSFGSTTAVRNTTDSLSMNVPDRILVAGGNQHIAAKSTPFEMQVENAVLPPTKDHVRVNTPPRSIRLDEHTFPSVNSDDEDDEGNHGEGSDSRQTEIKQKLLLSTPKRTTPGRAMPRSASVESDSFSYGRHHAGDPTLAISETYPGGSSHNITPWEEIQLVRRQIAKLNHRLMAVELENQQQQQREMLMTVLVSCYFVGKFIMWLNRSP